MNRKFLLTLIIIASVIQLIGAYFYFIQFANTGYASMIYTATKVIMLCLPVLAFVHLRKLLPNLLDIGTGKRAFVESVITSLVIFALLLAAHYVLLPISQEYAPNIRAKVIDFGIEQHFWTFAILFSLFHSLFEEVYWRWFVFGGLRKFVSWKSAMIISSIAFASHHYLVISQFVPIHLTVVFGLFPLSIGAFWCWQYQRTNTILTPWLSHIFADLALLTIAYLLVF